jgi:hypothetical protein
MVEGKNFPPDLLNDEYYKIYGARVNGVTEDQPLHQYYPVETKVMELCHIGYKHG